MGSHTLPYVVGTAATTAATTVILFCGLSTSDQTQAILSLSIHNNPVAATSGVDHGVTLFDRYNLVKNDNTKYKDHVETIYNFASNLLENIEDLPSDYSDVIDANFWDLM